MHPGFDTFAPLIAAFVSFSLACLIFEVNPVTKARNYWKVRLERKAQWKA